MDVENTKEFARDERRPGCKNQTRGRAWKLSLGITSMLCSLHSRRDDALGSFGGEEGAVPTAEAQDVAPLGGGWLMKPGPSEQEKSMEDGRALRNIQRPKLTHHG